jgi:hypothetical protein
MSYEARVREMVEAMVGTDHRDPRRLKPLLDNSSPDIVWDTRLALCDGDVYTGHRQIVDFFSDYQSCWEDWSYSLAAVLSFGPDVLTEIRESVRGRGGVVADISRWHLWHFEDGLLARWSVFCEREDALGALWDAVWPKELA